MKKTLAGILVMVLILGGSVSALAQERDKGSVKTPGALTDITGYKDVDVELIASTETVKADKAATANVNELAAVNIDEEVTVNVDETLTLKVGETVTFTAITLKHGSTYVDKWEGAVWNSTVLDSTTSQYVSTATFTPDKPGTYSITYNIDMTSGSSDTHFTGKVSKTVEVVGETAVTVAGLEARVVYVDPFVLDDGTVIGNSVIAEIYVLWSDGSKTPNSTTSLFLGPNENSITTDMSVIVDGVEYTYPITIVI